jgi:hypothetical protein
LAYDMTGSGVYYAGGGGGNRDGAGGLGGGGPGAFNVTPAAPRFGVTNTGGGAGSGWPGASSGGSGIVILRYPTAKGAASATTGSPNVTTVGSWRIYKFTESGTITFS